MNDTCFCQITLSISNHKSINELEDDYKNVRVYQWYSKLIYGHRIIDARNVMNQWECPILMFYFYCDKITDNSTQIVANVNAMSYCVKDLHLRILNIGQYSFQEFEGNHDEMVRE